MKFIKYFLLYYIHVLAWCHTVTFDSLSPATKSVMYAGLLGYDELGFHSVVYFTERNRIFDFV
jgi:hypothetical protein